MDQVRFLPAGDSALVVEFSAEISPAITARVHALARALEDQGRPGLGEAVPTYRSLLLRYDPLTLSYAEVCSLAADALACSQIGEESSSRPVEIPTVYGGDFGPDIGFVAAHNGLTPDDVIRLHSAATYTVAMLGFAPGFPYLSGLPTRLATPRLSTPRQAVPAGSVGIAGSQTGIYPSATPGGWQLIGRTPLALFDPRRDPPALLRPGDRVRFVPIPAEEFARLSQGAPAPFDQVEAEMPARKAALWLEVLDGGLLTTIQDRGRFGYERYGVPVGGAADPLALRAANGLVGNPANAAVLEITVVGPKLRPTADCLIAVAGADLSLRVNGWEMSPYAAILVRRGWVVEFGPRRNGCRAILAVAGGIQVAEVLGSRSTCLSGGFGGFSGRPLRAGDSLPVGRACVDIYSRAGLAVPPECIPACSDSPLVRVVLGPQDDYFTAEGLAGFLSGTYRVGVDSDRMGCRLQGPPIAHRGPAEIISDGVPLGAVQVPADRQPIVMLADHQPTGGYPKIATVISADIPLLGQCLPGESQLRFAAVQVDEAQALYRQVVRGWDTLDSSMGTAPGTP